MAISTNDELQTAVANWLNRDDLTNRIPEFITMAEARLQRDERVRLLTQQEFSATSEEESLPTDFRELESLYHDGPTYYGELRTVPADDLSVIRSRHSGEAAAPSHVAIVDNSTIRFAPIPDQTYTLEMVYWQTVPHLSDSSDNNWLLTNHPDIYLYATLVETAPYLRDDQRLSVWEGELENRLTMLDRHNQRQQYSGRLVKTVRNPIP